jgi:WD40 repeat protein
MNHSASPCSEREIRIDAAIAEYLSARQRGAPFDRTAWLAQHSDLASELNDFLADEAMFARAVSPWQGADTPPLGDDADATISQGRSAEHTADQSLPDQFGDYELLGEIARGGMGVVYRARQRSLNRVVALKVLLGARVASRTELDRFRREAEAAAALDHPHIVPIYEVGDYDGIPFFSMKLIDGSSLAKSPPASFAEMARLVATVARAVHHAHRRGIMHRDLKPSNVLIDEDGQPHVADFGLAKRIEATEGASISGSITGTPAYMAPEQARGQQSQLTVAVDVYGIGAVLYELLTGRAPFRGETTAETLVLVLHSEPARPSVSRPGLPRDLETICLKCLEKEPGKRYRSAEAVAEELERWLNDEPIQARPARRLERVVKWARRKPAHAAVAVISAFATVALVMTLAISNRLMGEEKRKTGDALEQKTTALDRLKETFEALEKAFKREKQLSYYRGVLLIDREIQANRIAQAEKILRTLGPPEQLGWEYHYLDRLCHPEPLDRYAGDSVEGLWHTHHLLLDRTGRRLALITPRDTLLSIAFWRNPVFSIGNIALTARLTVLDPTNGRKLREVKLPPPGGTGAAFALSGDGETLAAAVTQPYLIKPRVIVSKVSFLWVMRVGEEQWRPFTPDLDPKFSITALALNSDGSRIATESIELNPDNGNIGGNFIHVWNVASGKLVRAFEIASDGLWTALFSPDGRLLVAGNDVWDVESGAKVFAIHEAEFGIICGKAFRPDGKHLAVAYRDGTVRIWGIVGGKLLRTFVRVEGVEIAYSADGKRLAVGTAFGAKIIDAETGQELVLVRGPAEGHHAPAFIDGDRRLLLSEGTHGVVGTTPSRIGVWDVTRPQEARVITNVRKGPYGAALAFSPDGQWVATAGTGGQVKVWETQTGREVFTFSGHELYTYDVCFSPDGRFLASTGRDAEIRVWDLSTKKLHMAFKRVTPEFRRLSFRNDSKHLAVAHEEGVTVFDLESGQIFRTLGKKGLRSNAVAYSPEGARLLMVTDRFGHDFIVKLWDIAAEREIFAHRKNQVSVNSILFLKDGAHYLTAQRGSVAILWDGEGREVRRFEGHVGSVNSLALDVDEKRLFTAGSDGNVKVWDFGTGQEILNLTGHVGAVVGVAFGKDGWLASTGEDGTLRIWDGRPRVEAEGEAVGKRTP